MITREKHWEFKQRWNKLDSNYKKDFTPMEIDAILWDASLEYVEIFWSGMNTKAYNLGFEVTQQRRDMLSSLVVTQPLQPVIQPNVVNDNVYEFYLSKDNLTFDYLHFVRAAVKTNCGLINVKLERHNDLNYVLNDTFRKPSKKWKRLVATIDRSTNPDVESSLYIYSEEGFLVEDLCLEYIKVPDRPFIGGYNSIEYKHCIDTGGTNCASFYNSTSPSVNSDIPSNYHNILISIAVQETSRRLEDMNRFSLKKDKIKTIT